jgi:hypothetical protein
MDVEGVEVVESFKVVEGLEDVDCWWKGYLWGGRRVRRDGMAIVEMSIHLSTIEFPR